jgi:hypothetical protein
MSRLEIDKQRFKDFLPQFIGDAPYQIELVRTILDQMPIQVVKQFIEELYYEQVYDGPVYIAQHAVFKDDIHFFPNYQTLLRFLNEANKFSNEYNPDSLLTLDKKTVAKRMKNNLPLCGYLITMEGVDDEPTKTTTDRYSQFQ